MWVRTVLVIVVFLACDVRYDDATSVDAAYTDAWGNKINDDKTISWVKIPVGNKTYQTENSYDDGGLGLLFAFARNFIDTVQPNDFPFDVLKKVLNGTFDIGDNYMDLVQYSMGFAICFAIGLLFVIFLPLCGCCICCCRCCCGNCGGDLKAVYNENEDCKRMGMAQALFMMAILMSGSAGCVWMTNGRFTVALDYTQDTLVNNLDDLQIYFTNIGSQFEYLSGDMYSLVQKAIVDDIGDLGGVIEAAIFDNLGIDAVVTAVIELDTAVHNISDALDQVITDKNALVSSANALTSAMNTLGTDIDTTKSTCSSSGVSCDTACSTFDTTALKSGSADFSSLPDLTSVKSNIDNVKAMNLTGIALDAKAGVEDVSKTINDATTALKGTVNTTMNEFAGTISNMTSEVLATVNATVDTSGLKTGIGDFFGMMKNYDGYRVYFGWGLSGLFSLIVVMCLLGICCGCLGHDSETLPTERSSMSHCGGTLLIIPVVIMFIVGSLLMLLTTLSFVIGGNMEKLCQPLTDLTLFRDFIDEGAVSGMSLSKMIHGNASMNIGFYSLLLGCRANQAPFKLLGLDTLLPLESFLNYSQYTSSLSSDLQSMSSIDLSSFSILTPDMTNSLNDLQNSGLNDINFTQINDTLGQPLVSVDFNALITAMTAIRDSCRGSVYSSWDTHISDTENIRDVTYPAVVTAQNDLKNSMAVLEGHLSGFGGKVNNTLDTATAADNQLANNVTGVFADAIDDFVAQVIGYIDSYATEAIDIVYNEIGRCLPLWNLYDSFTNIICRYMVESLNAFWFGTGWGLLFFIPVMVLSMKLSKYYRRMNKQEGYKEEEDPLDEDIDDFSVRYDMMQRHRKVAPDPDFMD